LKTIPIIDLFAGPGGLGEGFSRYQSDQSRFEIKLSIEKDKYAHETLLLRSFTRQFKEKLPKEYYSFIMENDLNKKATKKEKLFEVYKEQYQKASTEAWNAELGNQKFPNELVDQRIHEKIKNTSEWILIGGPPCQAYSLIGRSRVGGIDEKDNRVYLYKEYLRIIAKHQPSVFVMENVRGLLSAKVNDKSVFQLILKDLKNPARVYKTYNTPQYKIYSLVNKPDGFTQKGEPLFSKNKDFLIECEKYGIPQRRHRVILLGVRNDIQYQPEQLMFSEKAICISDVICDLPALRSGIGRKFNRKKSDYYSETDSFRNWIKTITKYSTQLKEHNEKLAELDIDKLKTKNLTRGAEFISGKFSSNQNPLKTWYSDKNLKGVCNHKTRTHLDHDLRRYLISTLYAKKHKRFPRLSDVAELDPKFLPNHTNAKSGKFNDRFRVQLEHEPATTITSHISKDGHYYIHYDPYQCRSLTVREAARIQTFPDNYFFCGPRTAQYQQVGNAVPPYLAHQIADLVSKIFVI